MGTLEPYSSLIREMWEAGEKDPAILDALAERGILVSGVTLWKHRVTRGMRSKRGHAGFQHSEKLRMARKQGLTYEQLAERFGISQVTVWKYLKRSS